jgi:hypothetical protein
MAWVDTLTTTKTHSVSLLVTIQNHTLLITEHVLATVHITIASTLAVPA